MNAVDSEQYMSLLGGAVDTGASADLSNMAEITGILSSLYFPEALVQLISDAIERIYDITSCSGLQIFIFLAGLQNISPSLYEAAEIEGCSKWELFWKITFPMISPILVMNLVYSIADRAMDGEAFDYINTLAFGAESIFPGQCYEYALSVLSWSYDCIDPFAREKVQGTAGMIRRGEEWPYDKNFVRYREKMPDRTKKTGVEPAV